MDTQLPLPLHSSPVNLDPMERRVLYLLALECDPIEALEPIVQSLIGRGYIAETGEGDLLLTPKGNQYIEDAMEQNCLHGIQWMCRR